MATKEQKAQVGKEVIKLPRVKGESHKMVEINGHRYMIPRGQEVEVPAEVAAVIRQSQYQKELALDYNESIKQ